MTLRSPSSKPHPWRRLAGTGANAGLGPGVAIAGAGIRYEVVAVFGQSRLSVRVKTATAGGTIDIVFVGPDFDPDQTVAYASLTGTKYTTGNPTQVAVSAGTEALIQANCLGDGFALIKFTGGGTGTISYIDVALSQVASQDVNVSLVTSDVEIGAVEIKNGADDTRAKVGVASAAAVGDNALTVADPNQLPAAAGGVGGKNVTVAATAEALGSSQACRAIIITARPANTGKIAVGMGASTLATAGSEAGVILSAGASVVLSVSNRNLVYVDATVSGEGVAYCYLV